MLGFLSQTLKSPLVWAATVVAFLALALFLSPHPESPAWGVNGRVSLLGPADLEKRLLLLEQAKVKWLREDYRSEEPGSSRQGENLTSARSRGFKVLAIVPYVIGSKPSQPEDQLPEDLREVFQAAQTWSEKSAKWVDAWELFNEADVGFCRDLPDRSTAYMKAVYLGLKAGRPEKLMPVISGALALPPGPWLDRAVRNGLMEYADAYNFHYYGHPGDLEAVTSMHRDFARRADGGLMPLWITESGYEAADDPGATARQQEYFKTITPLAAAAQQSLASFMPYALKDREKFNLLDSHDGPRPAWSIFSEEAGINPLPNGLVFAGDKISNPIVCQWLPGSGACVPHKVSGTYRFRYNAAASAYRPMPGEIRLYNFGEQTARGTLEMKGLQAIWAEPGFARSIEIPAHGMTSVPVVFNTSFPGYQKEWCEVQFRKEGDRSVSSLYFGLETPLRETDFKTRPLVFEEIPAAKTPESVFQYINAPQAYSIGSESNPWRGLNGLKLKSAEGGRKLVLSRILDTPEPFPPMAVAKVKGLYSCAFLRIKSDTVFDRNFHVRVDLIDAKGQRFSVFENGGMSYFEKTKELWLNLEDFHLYFWGRCLNPEFDPAQVREIQLRPYFREAGKDVSLELALVAAKPIEP